ncbi:macrophage mannose receptor 1-like [Carassius auratus]|uniref:Macrophage mannose receptor 1-like n=1 Tax=Carassius auratus TaxID=7957 RepID=A0A6P6NPR1_CARAU|nr:macrophage mannose receptor 1-like [Carassius auratus]
MQINDALNACRHNYTDLVTIYDDNDNATLAKMIVNGSMYCGWIGANSCTWSNGDPVTFNNITRNFTEESCCGALNTDGTWECFNCSSQMYFMCYKQGSLNYSLIPENKTWFAAQKHCRRNHSDLVSIRNQTENERVKEAVNGSNSIWIGFRYNYSLAWFDGGHSDYEKIHNVTGETNNAGCFTFLSKQLPESWSKSNLNTCGALCYKSFIHVSSKKMSWEEALDYCSSNFSGLLRIESEDDQVETEREIKRKKVLGPVWVGLRQSRLFGFWIWYNGLSVGNWTNWKEGSPPEHQVSQHCGALEKVKGQYKWCDKDCRSEFITLCELK